MGLAHAMMMIDFSLLQSSFALQTILVGIVIGTIVWSYGTIARLQVMAWVIAVLVIYLRFGNYGQLVFYSNDQLYHESLVSRLMMLDVPTEAAWWITGARAPYVLPATLLSTAGIDPVLALKTVSLLSYLSVTSFLQKSLERQQIPYRLSNMYWTCVGVVGLFFSALALRETTMMLISTYFFLHKSAFTRGWALVFLGLLRPHLAIALLLGWIAVRFSRRIGYGHWSPARFSSVIITGAICGYLLYAIGTWIYFRNLDPGQHRGGIVPIVRIASNFFGLQFLAANETTVESSLASLVAYRVVMSETLLIPASFVVVACLSRRLSITGQMALWSFAIYVGLATNTAFNSFRQNIPFMPVMGVVVLDEWRRRQLRIGAPSPSSLAKPSR